MGIFLSCVQQEIGKFQSRNNDFCVQPLSKIYQYHAIFKSVCDTFSIDREQFMQIFTKEDSFDIWDKEKTNKIDALQLFTGLICFSTEATFKEKLRFLFEIFDFNEIKTISLVDLEYMIVCICNSTFKMLKKNAKINNNEVSQFLKKRFKNSKQRINITTLYNFCKQSYQISKFFTLLKTQIISSKEKKYSRKNKRASLVNFAQQDQPILNNHIKMELDSEMLQLQQVQWYNRICKQLYHPVKTPARSVIPQQQWIFGINTDVHKPFIILPDQILYVTSNIAIKYSIELNEQKIYNKHRKQLISIAYSERKNLIATGEIGQNPKVHLWDASTLTTRTVINTLHKNGVQLMEFIQNDESLVTVGVQIDTTIIIYSTNTYDIIYSSFLPTAIFHMKTIFSHIDETQLQERSEYDYLLCHTKGVNIFRSDKKEIHCLNFNIDQDNRILTDICSCSAIIINLNNPFLKNYTKKQEYNLVVMTGHQGGQLCLVYEKQPKFKTLLKLQKSITQIQFCNQSILISSGQKILIYSLQILAEIEELPKEISLDKIDFNLLSTRISYFSTTVDTILLLTTEGEALHIFSNEYSYQNDQFIENYEIRKINSIIKFSVEMTALSIIQKCDLDDRILFCAIDHEKIASISLLNHQLIDVWTLPDHITVIDSISLDTGVTYIVVGCQSGKLYIRLDWQQFPRYFSCSSKIIEVKLAFDCSYLIVCTKDNHMFIFSNMNNNFIVQTPKKIHFENQCPISINFLNDSKSFLVCTNARNIYQFYLPELKHKNILKENEKVYASIISPTFSYKLNKEYEIAMPGLIGGNCKIFLISDENGRIKAYQNLKELELNCYTVLLGHISPISKILMLDNQESFISMGRHDHTIIQWKLNEFRDTSSVSFKQTIFQKHKSIQKRATVEQNNKIFTLKIEKKEEPQSLFNKFSLSFSHKDQYTLFRGTKSNILNEHFRKTIKKWEPNQFICKRPPNISLEIKNVTGIECFKSNISAFYCKKFKNQVVYFTSRFLIKLNIQTKKQEVIEKFRGKISCIAISEKGIIGLGQQSRKPRIYVEPNTILTTTHKLKILHMTFYHEYVFSYGMHPPAFSINIHNYKTGELVNERLTKERIQRFFVIQLDYFITINQIFVWKKLNSTTNLGEATAGDHFLISDDLCLGNKNGDLMILSHQNIYKVRQKAHQKAISVIKFLKLEEYDFEIITSADDELIKIWDKCFREKKVIELRIELILNHLNDQSNSIIPSNPIQVGSLDIYDKKLLVLLTNGQLIEIQLQSVKEKKQASEIIESSILMSQTIVEEKSTLENYQLKINNIFIHHPSSQITTKNKISFSLHHDQPIIATVGDDHQLLVSNYNTNTIIGRYLYQKKISCVKFGNIDKIIALGFNDGELRLYQFKLKYEGVGNPTIFTLNLMQSLNQIKSGIINMEFSLNNKELAVSHLPTRLTKKIQKMEDFEESEKSVVVLYKNKESNNQVNQNHFYKFDEIWQNLTESYKISQSRAIIGVYLLKFLQYQKNKYLLLYYESINQIKLRIHNDSSAEYRLYSLIQKNLIKQQQINIDWLETKFPNYINCVYMDQDKTANTLDQIPIITEMVIEGDYIFYGGFNGNIYIVKKQSLFLDKNLSELCKTDMCLGKTYPSHISLINQMEINYNKQYLFVSGAFDDSVIQFKIIWQALSSELDNSIYKLEIQDIHNQVFNKSKFYNQINNIIPIREDISSILSDVQQNIESQVTLNVAKIIGRRAMDRRNNIFIDKLNQIIYNLGPNIIIQELYSNRQRYVTGDPSENSSTQQISTFTLDQSGTLLALATEEQKSKVIVWDINSKICLSITEVKCCIIQNLAFSKDHQYIALTGIDESYSCVVMLLDWKSKTLLCQASLLYTAVWKIKDMVFLNNTSTQFVTCGVKHLCLWKFNAQILTYKNFHIQKQETTFLCCCEYKEFLFTGCEKGNIYIWKDFELCNKITEAHLGVIRCLKFSINMLVSGGDDAKVCYFEISQDNLVLKKSIKLNKQTEDIQSLAIDKEKCVYAGTRSGDIYQITYEDSSIKNLISCHDCDISVSICFDKKSEYLYEISQSGILQMWKLDPITRVYCYNFELKSIKLLNFQDYLIIVFQRQIQVLDIKNLSTNFQEKYHISLDETIYQAEISDTNILVIATIDKQKNNLILYKAIQGSKLQILKKISLQFEIQYFDFSIDNKYLLYKNKHEDIGIIELQEVKKINTLFIEMELEWQSDGIRLNQKAMMIHSAYSQQNIITAIAKYNDSHLFVADQMGTIRIFDYPCNNTHIGQLHLKCYTQHMNFINNLKISEDEKWLASTSKMDKSLIIWKINKKIPK